MNSLLHRPIALWIVVALLLGVVLTGQAIVDSTVGASFTSTGDAVGRAGFAYVTGLRTFVAAVLWNRLEPQYHDYYDDKPLVEQTQMMPIVNLVVLLDPQFLDAYYVAPWILARRGDINEALDLAALGVENNPDSGLMRVNYAQTLWNFGDDLPGAVEQAEIALGETMRWRDPIEQHDSYAVLSSLYRNAGYDERVTFVLAEIERLDAEIGDQLPAGEHDHDGDGKPDH